MSGTARTREVAVNTATDRFIELAKKKGLDVRISEDKTRIELFSMTTGRKLCSSPVADLIPQPRP